MNTTLAFNVIATVAAGLATIWYSTDALVMMSPSPFRSYGCCSSRILGQGVSSVLAVFHVLEFIITIVLSAFLCKSTCDCCKQQQPAYVVPGNTPMAPQAQASYSAPASVVQLPQQVMHVSNPADGQSSPGFTDPPPYSEEIKGF